MALEKARRCDDDSSADIMNIRAQPLRLHIGALGVAVTAFACGGSRAGTTSTSPPPPSPSGPVGTTDLRSSWKVQSSAIAGSTVAGISKPSYSTQTWLPISQPETLMAALVENGQYPNIFFSNNLSN